MHPGKIEKCSPAQHLRLHKHPLDSALRSHSARPAASFQCDFDYARIRTAVILNVAIVFHDTVRSSSSSCVSEISMITPPGAKPTITLNIELKTVPNTSRTTFCVMASSWDQRNDRVLNRLVFRRRVSHRSG